jgi:hypothetical protein
MHIEKPGAHINELLRQTRNHHVQLSSMADFKANMLLTLASLVLTFSLRYLSDPYLRWPVLVLLAFCFVTILFAALAVLPNVRTTRRSAADKVAMYGRNPLFFGNFLDLDYDEYAARMELLLNDPDQVYEVQVQEVYELGVYLGLNKYRYIRWAYQTFIAGVLCSGVAFVIVELILFT